MASALKSNPSFIGQDGKQIDVTFYSKKTIHGKDPKPTVVIKSDDIAAWIYLDPRDIPTLIEALQIVSDQYDEFVEQNGG